MNIAIVGATGNVGRKIIEVLENKNFPISELYLIASSKSAGQKINFKDTKSRWGSCSSTGSIMINWRLIMAPPSVYNYVISHELAHLVHMNHGPLFWKLVQELSPNYSKDKQWLKKNGREIRRYIF